MRRYVYKMLTLRNNIIINKEALKHLSESISAEDLPAVSSEMKKQPGIVFDLEAVKKVLAEIQRMKEEDRVRLFKITSFPYKKRNETLRLKFLRDRIRKITRPIYSLKQGYRAVIFGIYCINNMGSEILDDGQESVVLDFSSCDDDAFLHENIFIGVEGFLIKNVFRVKKILFPQILLDVGDEYELADKKCNFLVFNDFEWDDNNFDLLKEVIDGSENLRLVIFLGERGVNSFIPVLLKLYENIFFVAVPARGYNNEPFLPNSNDPAYSGPNSLAASNPFEIRTENKKIGVIVDEVFDAKRNGRYLGTSYLESFIRTFLSQYSFNPFSNNNLSFKRHFEIVIVAQDTFSCVLNYCGVKFASVGSFRKEKSYIRHFYGDVSVAELEVKQP